MGEGELTGERFLYCFFFEFTQSLTSFQLFLFSFRIYSALYIGESFCIFFFLFSVSGSLLQNQLWFLVCVPHLPFAQGRCCDFDVLRVLTGSATCPTAQFDRTRYSRRRQGEAAGYRCFLGFGPVRGKCRGHPVGERGRPLLQWRGRAALHLFGGSWHQLPS